MRNTTVYGMMISVILALRPESQVYYQYLTMLDFSSQLSQFLYQSYFSFAQTEEQVYGMDFFREQLDKITKNFDQLFARVLEARKILSSALKLQAEVYLQRNDTAELQPRQPQILDASLLFACRMRGVIPEFLTYFGRYVSLDAYETTEPSYCEESQPGIETVKMVFETIFSLENDTNRLTNIYGQIAYGVRDKWLWYPVSGEELDFNHFITMFSNYNEAIFIPIDYRADPQAASDLRKRIFSFQLNDTTEQNDQKLYGNTCDELCELIIKYLDEEQNEQQGRAIILYDAEYYYMLTNSFVYGQQNRISNWMRQIVNEKARVPYAENILKMVLDAVSALRTHSARFYVDQHDTHEYQHRYESTGEKRVKLDNFPFVVQLVLPQNYSVDDYTFYSQILFDFRKINAQVNILCFKNEYICDHLNADLGKEENFLYTGFQYMVSPIQGIYQLSDAMRVFKNKIDQSGAHEYALRMQYYDDGKHMIIGQRIGADSYFFVKVPLQYLLEVASNCRILVHSALISNYDFHIFGERTDLIKNRLEEAFEQLTERQRGILFSKPNTCVSSASFQICKAHLSNVQQISAIILVQTNRLPYSPVDSRPDEWFYLSQSDKQQICYYREQHDQSLCTVYLYPLPYGHSGFFSPGSQELKGGFYTLEEYDQLIEELFQYEYMDFDQFLAQQALARLTESHKGDPLVVTQHLYLISQKPQLQILVDDIFAVMQQECPTYVSDMFQACVIIGIDVFMCGAKNARFKMSGFEKYYDIFWLSKRKQIYQLPVKCFDVFENNTEDECYMVVFVNEQYKAPFAFTVFVLSEYYYRNCFLQYLYDGYDVFAVPAGIYDLDTQIYEDLNGFAQNVAFSVMLETGTAFCKYYENGTKPHVGLRLAQVLENLSYGKAYSVGNIITFLKYFDNRVYLFYIAGNTPTAVYGCENTSFNILFDQNRSYTDTIRSILGNATFSEKPYIAALELHFVALALVTTLVILAAGLVLKFV